MLLPARIKLLFATILAASTLTFVIAAYPSTNVTTQEQAAGRVLKSKILRPSERLNEKPNAYELALLRKGAGIDEERLIEDKIPNHIPIKTRLKPEKEKKFKSLENSEWYRDFELEVTNTSDRRGDEVIQAYVEDVVASVAPPVRRLIAFERRTIELGMINVTSVVADSNAAEKALVFFPTTLTDGIELSDDPFPALRTSVYALSFAHRQQR